MKLRDIKDLGKLVRSKDNDVMRNQVNRVLIEKIEPEKWYNFNIKTGEIVGQGFTNKANAESVRQALPDPDIIQTKQGKTLPRDFFHAHPIGLKDYHARSA